MQTTILSVPGYHGSGPAHWQTWLESQLPECQRVTGIDWEKPIVTRWADRICQEIDKITGKVWIVAHSFGCLASALAIANSVEKIAGAAFVAPANPKRFAPLGVRHKSDIFIPSILSLLPQSSLGITSVLVASENDPWMSYVAAKNLADRWGCDFYNAGQAGHINTESGFGPWPDLLVLLKNLKVLSPHYAFDLTIHHSLHEQSTAFHSLSYC